MTSRRHDGPDELTRNRRTAATLSDKDRAETIDRLYDVALDPVRFEALLDENQGSAKEARSIQKARFGHLSSCE